MKRKVLDAPEISWPDELMPLAPAKIAYTIRQAVLATGLSRSSLYLAIRRGALRVRKHGHRSVILAEDLRSFMRGLPLLKTGDG
jgi:hypothetical protein